MLQDITIPDNYQNLELMAFTVLVSNGKKSAQASVVHFKACIRHDSLGWYLYDDKLVKKLNDREVTIKKKKAYYLVFSCDNLRLTSLQHQLQQNKLTEINHDTDKDGSNRTSREKKRNLPHTNGNDSKE